MVQIKGNNVILNKSRELTARQLLNIKQLSESRKKDYLLSLLGLSKKKIWIDRVETDGLDTLSRKKPNCIFEMLKHMRNSNQSHVPLNKDQGEWIGVEIECFVPNGQPILDKDGDEIGSISDEYEARTYVKQCISRIGVSRVEVKFDGSLECEDGEGFGIEVTLVFNNKASGFESLNKLCNALNEAGCYINKTCGLHVHLDVRNLDKEGVRLLGRKLTRCLPVLKHIMPESRHNNRYCRLGMSRFGGDRYFAVNLTSYKKFKTIEIRLHSGTVDFEKIKNWIEVLQAIRKSEITVPQTKFQQLIDTLNLSDKLVEYLERRITKLNPSAWGELSQLEQPELEVA